MVQDVKERANVLPLYLVSFQCIRYRNNITPAELAKASIEKEPLNTILQKIVVKTTPSDGLIDLNCLRISVGQQQIRHKHLPMQTNSVFLHGAP